MYNYRNFCTFCISKIVSYFLVYVMLYYDDVYKIDRYQQYIIEK